MPHNDTSFKPGQSGNPSGKPADGEKRERGRPTMLTVEQRKQIAKDANITPLQFLMSVVVDDEEDIERRIDAAKAAAPYFHRKRPIGIDDGKGGAVKTFNLDVIALSKLSDSELAGALALAEKLGAMVPTDADDDERGVTKSAALDDDDGDDD